ncbi:MAG TPA: M56 family metallopeptidase [Chitinophagaceae bacterium]|nr:M56 family metallopeptidase [Chitinophagaceae bacterium]
MIPYIIKAGLILAGCLAFYKILLRRETFYRINRHVLIVCLLISFSLPLLQVPQQWSLRKKQNTTIISPSADGGKEQQSAIDNPSTSAGTKQSTTGSQPPTANPSTSSGQSSQQSTTKDPQSSIISHPSSFSFNNVMKWIIWLYWFGVIVFGINFLFQVVVLLFKAYRNPVILDGKYRIVEVSGDKAPCSFGNNIFINPEKYEWETYNQIIQHEKVHIRERHSIDIIFSELVLIFQWFNPFAWIYRREIENNLEFLTDDQLMREKVEKTSYQLSLLKVSAPHFPLSLTTNYNQSILKKRIAMMNTKKSNLHTTWKYFFLLPVLALFASLLNEPVAKAGSNQNVKKEIKSPGFGTEGYWFAIIKDDKVNIRFSEDDDIPKDMDLHSGHSFSATTFKLSELSNIPKGTAGTFTITREAGKMEMKGKFEDNTGMGTYKFVADKAFMDYVKGEVKGSLDEDDEAAFFFIDVKKSYVQMLKATGFNNLSKDDLVAMAALKVDAAFIQSIRNSGFKDVSGENLVTLKALGIDEGYIKEIKSTGYKNLNLDKLISFKAQGIDKDYINKIKSTRGKDSKDLDDDDDDYITTFKALDITDEFANSFKTVGFTDLSNENLVTFKSLGITPDFIKSFQSAGFKDLSVEDITSLKAMGIAPDFAKQFEPFGIKNLEIENLTSLKAMNVTPEFIKSFEAIGYKNLDVEELTSLKALSITPEYIKGFEAIGYKNIPIEDLTGLKATNVTPAFITDMKAKGFNYTKLQKYITLKTMED